MIKIELTIDKQDIIIARNQQIITINEQNDTLNSDELFNKIFKLESEESNCDFELVCATSEELAKQINDERVKGYYESIQKILTNTIEKINMVTK